MCDRVGKRVPEGENSDKRVTIKGGSSMGGWIEVKESGAETSRT